MLSTFERVMKIYEYIANADINEISHYITSHQDLRFISFVTLHDTLLKHTTLAATITELGGITKYSHLLNASKSINVLYLPRISKGIEILIESWTNGSLKNSVLNEQLNDEAAKILLSYWQQNVSQKSNDLIKFTNEIISQCASDLANAWLGTESKNHPNDEISSAAISGILQLFDSNAKHPTTALLSATMEYYRCRVIMQSFQMKQLSGNIVTIIKNTLTLRLKHRLNMIRFEKTPSTKKMLELWQSHSLPKSLSYILEIVLLNVIIDIKLPQKLLTKFNELTAKSLLIELHKATLDRHLSETLRKEILHNITSVFIKKSVGNTSDCPQIKESIIKHLIKPWQKGLLEAYTPCPLQMLCLVDLHRAKKQCSQRLEAQVKQSTLFTKQYEDPGIEKTPNNITSVHKTSRHRFLIGKGLP